MKLWVVVLAACASSRAPTAGSAAPIAGARLAALPVGAFVAAYSPDGALHGVVRATELPPALRLMTAEPIVLDHAGDVIVCGAAGWFDGFVVAIAPNGAVVWHADFTFVEIVGTAIAPGGDVLVAGAPHR